MSIARSSCTSFSSFALAPLAAGPLPLSGPGATAIDDYHHRVVSPIFLLVREIFLLLIFLASLRVDDQAAVEEIIGNFHRLIQQSARIIAQIEDQSLDLAVILRFELVDRFLDALARILLESGYADVAISIGQHLRFDRLNLDDVAREADGEQLGHAVAMQGQLDLAALGPAHPLGGVGERRVLGEVVVNLDNLVAGLDSGVICRSGLDRRHY